MNLMHLKEVFSNKPLRASNKMEKSSSSVQLVLDINKAVELSNLFSSSYDCDNLRNRSHFSSSEIDGIMVGPGLSYKVTALQN